MLKSAKPFGSALEVGHHTTTPGPTAGSLCVVTRLPDVGGAACYKCTCVSYSIGKNKPESGGVFQCAHITAHLNA